MKSTFSVIPNEIVNFTELSLIYILEKYYITRSRFLRKIQHFFRQINAFDKELVMRGDFTGIFWAWLRFVALFHTALCRCAKMPWNRSNMISRKNSTSLKNDYSKLQSIKSNWRKNCKRHMNVEQQKKITFTERNSWNRQRLLKWIFCNKCVALSHFPKLRLKYT